MNTKRSLHQSIESDFLSFIKNESERFPKKDTLRIDLHCHDHNSSEPDELLGRMLGIPETWLSTDDLLRVLGKHGCDTFTVTNHNNARSCFDLLDKGVDVLTGAEWSCMVPKYSIGIHVLAYGFTPSDEEKLKKLRKDIFPFLEYCNERNIPTICAHPFYHYKGSSLPPMEFFDTLMLLFERFEGVNGQRDTWQNMLVRKWISRMTKESIDEAGKRLGIDPSRFCKDPYRKGISGGSDAHMGIFSGLTGTNLYVPNLKARLVKEPRSALALEALRENRMAPFGSHNDSEKMTVTFIDYLCQIALNMEDPGLLRIIMHKGEARDKLISLAVTNSFAELRRHKTTMAFLKTFHEALMGKNPSLPARLLVKKAYRPIIEELSRMAEFRRDNPLGAAKEFSQSLDRIFLTLNNLAAVRAKKRLSDKRTTLSFENVHLNDVIAKLEFPSTFRSFTDTRKKKSEYPMSSFPLTKVLDDLSFPVLGSAIVLAASFTGAKVMYNARPLVREMSKRLGVYHHKPRALWLTDTWNDSNGVATVLKDIHAEIKRNDLPIDMLVCSNDCKPDDHLHVLKPIADFTLPFYANQPLRIPNMMEIHRIFHEGEYDRIICSTEGFMGVASLYLKHAYSVPASLYVHTDWITFSRDVLKLDHHGRSRFRRYLRMFYKQFDDLFVLNTDQRNFFTSSAFGFAKNKVHKTAHWVDEKFIPQNDNRSVLFGVSDSTPILLFAGRVSEEKGVMDLPKILSAVRKTIPNVKLVIAGKGPAEEKLRALLPDEIFLGWIPHEKLPEIYSSADMLVLPSRFDTFGCVVLEALSCGLPVAAYSTKGPKEIIEHEKSGFLCATRDEIIQSVVALLSNNDKRKEFGKSATKRSKIFSADRIVTAFLYDAGLNEK